jgi:hypothetical protein
MSIAEMQACIARLYVDEPFRKMLHLDPSSALDGYRLTADEDAAIRGIDSNALEQFAGSLVAKRRKRIERAYPLLFRMDSREVQRLYARFYQLYTAKPYQPGDQEVIEFGVFAEQSLVNTDHLPSYAGDLARYERLYYWATVSGEWDAGEEETTSDNTRVVTDMAARPSLAPNVTVSEFAHDVAAVEEALQKGEDPAAIRAIQRCSIVFRPAVGNSAVQMLRVNAPTKQILDLCNGRRTVAEIIVETETALGAVELRGAILDTLNRLSGLRVLALDAVPEDGRDGQLGFGSATQVESV